MKKSRYVAACISAAMMPLLMASCSSDPNPVDNILSAGQSTGHIRLDFNVAETRAGSNSTDAEDKITKINIYVFNAQGKLEKILENQTYKSGSIILESSTGQKIVYAITSTLSYPEDRVARPVQDMSMTDFENIVFSADLAKLTDSSAGFVMIGKSEPHQVLKSASQDEIPASNVFAIDLVRAVAKAQVVTKELSFDSKGFRFGAPEFRTCQTYSLMRVATGAADINPNYSDSDSDGTYDAYSNGSVTDFINAQTTFKNTNCCYLAENIVTSPKSGNTTFLSVRFTANPRKYYEFNNGDTHPTESNVQVTGSTTFYAVGIIDELHGMADYAMDLDKDRVITFNNKDAADRYTAALNGGTASAVTVSETESPLQTRAGSVDDGHIKQFQTVAFPQAQAYYRINIIDKDEEGANVYRVKRNKFYKVEIKSVNTLGYNSESMLFPKNADADLEAHGSVWIESAFNVSEWTEQEQPVDL